MPFIHFYSLLLQRSRFLYAVRPSDLLIANVRDGSEQTPSKGETSAPAHL